MARSSSEAERQAHNLAGRRFESGLRNQKTQEAGMNTREIEIIGASGHGIGMAINVLGYVWNRKKNLFFQVFHIAAAGVHAYALYTHISKAREENGNEE